MTSPFRGDTWLAEDYHRCHERISVYSYPNQHVFLLILLLSIVKSHKHPSQDQINVMYFL